MPKFTPGPWIVAHRWNVQSADSPKRRAVASTAVHSRNEATDDENAANARLIAAAPEMYELLREKSRKRDFYSDASMARLRALLSRIDGDDT